MDRRQQKTRAAIFGAFEQLVAEQHYQNVTVAQIIDRANVGRTTFYAHFETKDELLDSMCTEMFDHIFEGVNTDCITHVDLDAHDLCGRFAHLLYHLRDTHAGVCAKLLAEGEPRFTQDFKTRLRGLIVEFVPKIPEGVPRDYAVDILCATFLDTVTWWYAENFIQDPKDLAHWYARLTNIASYSPMRQA